MILEDAKIKDLTPAVRQYFADHHLDQHGGLGQVVKLFSLLLLWFFVYFATCHFFTFSYSLGILGAFLLACVHGALSMGVMHDGTHHSFSKYKILNSIATLILPFSGVSSIAWHAKHIVAHHSDPNRMGKDLDIYSGGLFRFHAGDTWYFYHRFQHYYALFLYALLLPKWVWVDDFLDFLRWKGRKKWKLGLEIILSRLWHISLYFVVPFFWIGNIKAVLCFYTVFMLTVSFLIAVTFQLAHVGLKQKFVDQEETEDWFLRQILATSNFSTSNDLLTWCIGGLNFQIEHHLFPGMSHRHYKKIRPIVKAFCEEHGVPYLEEETIYSALRSHLRCLKTFSRPNAPQAES